MFVFQVAVFPFCHTLQLTNNKGNVFYGMYMNFRERVQASISFRALILVDEWTVKNFTMLNCFHELPCSFFYGSIYVILLIYSSYNSTFIPCSLRVETCVAPFFIVLNMAAASIFSRSYFSSMKREISNMLYTVQIRFPRKKKYYHNREIPFFLFQMLSLERQSTLSFI